jgi:hypothetical protein
MKFRNVITAAAIAALPFAAQAATLVIPAAGTGPGSNDSQWQTELTIHTAAPRPVVLSIAFHSGTSSKPAVQVTLQPRQTLSINDIVKTKFGVEAGTGALTIEADDRDAKTLAITSRTFNTLPNAIYGQDVPAIDAAQANAAGDIAALPFHSPVAATRFNFGVFATTAATVKWEVVRANGTVAASKEVTYAANQHVQYNNGVNALLGVNLENNDTVRAHVLSGRAFFYGSVVNETGDPSYIPGIRMREDIRIQFAGIDLDENGTVDVADANEDGVLDAPIDVFTSFFPNFFRIVAEGEFGEDVTYEVIAAETLDTRFLDENGTLRVFASGNVKGTTGEIRVRATTGGSSEVLVIPVRFR